MKLRLTDHANLDHEHNPHVVEGPRKQIDGYLAGPLSADTDSELSTSRIAGARRALTEGDIAHADRLLEPLKVRIERLP